MRALIVILIIIAVIALAMHIPVRVRLYAKYENSRFVNDYEIKYGFITVKRRKKKSKEKPQGEKPKQKKKSDKPSPLKSVKFIKENIKLIKRLITDVTGYATKKLIRFDEFELSAALGVDDAMDTALYYGGASAFLYNTIGAMERVVKMKNISIDFKPDFTESKIFIEFQCIIRTKIHNVMGLAWLAFLRAMPILKKRGETKNGKSD